VQHRLYIVGRHLECTQKLSCRLTRLGAALHVDRQSRCTTSCCRPSSGIAQAAVEQKRQGTVQTTVLKKRHTDLPRDSLHCNRRVTYRLLCCRTDTSRGSTGCYGTDTSRGSTGCYRPDKSKYSKGCNRANTPREAAQAAEGQTLSDAAQSAVEQKRETCRGSSGCCRTNPFRGSTGCFRSDTSRGSIVFFRKYPSWQHRLL
jgi:hypothetical protein